MFVLAGRRAGVAFDAAFGVAKEFHACHCCLLTLSRSGTGSTCSPASRSLNRSRRCSPCSPTPRVRFVHRRPDSGRPDSCPSSHLLCGTASPRLLFLPPHPFPVFYVLLLSFLFFLSFLLFFFFFFFFSFFFFFFFF